MLTDSALRRHRKKEGLALFSYLFHTFPTINLTVIAASEGLITVRLILAHGRSSVENKCNDVGHIVTAIYSSYADGNYLSPTITRAFDEIRANVGRRG
ncbi:hypothetical protein [Burkholderia territorii]|uniref:hypothetical protein n=1 Tax=Burkholderia territorii TaxID=1503055 RepID=UPI0012DB300C|nr:hypothetical protein [Burkholderia territorii]